MLNVPAPTSLKEAQQILAQQQADRVRVQALYPQATQASKKSQISTFIIPKIVSEESQQKPPAQTKPPQPDEGKQRSPATAKHMQQR